MEKKTVNKFWDLNVYQRARELTQEIYSLTRTLPFCRDFGLIDQIRRASVSVMSNIAEGFERGTRNEFILFLYIAKGSCGEVRAQLDVALDQKYIDKTVHHQLYEKCNLVSGMIGNFISYLKKSKYSGIKHKPQL
jgi:four helix bundle protein